MEWDLGPSEEALFHERGNIVRWASTWILAPDSSRFASGLFHLQAIWVRHLIFMGLSFSSVTWDQNTSVVACENVIPAMY